MESSNTFARSRYSSPADHMVVGSDGRGYVTWSAYRAANAYMARSRRVGTRRGRLNGDVLLGPWLPPEGSAAIARSGDCCVSELILRICY